MSAGPLAAPAAVEVHVRELAARLRGPRRLRTDLLREARAGLEDAAEAHQRRGRDAAEAQRLAVAEFGGLDDVAASFQERLLVAQGRATARLLLATFPGLLLAWDLLWTTGTGWSQAAPLVVALARAVDGVSLATGAAALVVLALLARAERHPGGARGAVTAVAVLGGLAALACGTASVAMNVVGDGAGDLLARQPLAVLAYGTSAAAVVLVLRSVARSLRLAAHRG